MDGPDDVPEARIQVGHRMVPDFTDYAEVDRMSLAWRRICQGHGDSKIALELGIGEPAVREYRKTMPRWWGREYERIGS